MTTAAPTSTDDRDVPSSALVLIAANLVPLVGVLAFHWTVFSVVLLYWCENVVVGAFNVLKILFAQPQSIATNLGKLFLIPFFTVHYGMFTLVHGIFVLFLFGPKTNAGPSVALFETSIREARIGFAVLAIIVSHGYSFVVNYLGSGEFRRASPPQLMTQPYARVVVLHLTIMTGGFATMALGAPMAALLVLIVLKTAIDYRAHLSERRKLGAAATA